jgi:hypothetical protein
MEFGKDIIDVTAPGGAIAGLVAGSGNAKVNSNRIRAIVSEYWTGQLHTDLNTPEMPLGFPTRTLNSRKRSRCRNLLALLNPQEDNPIWWPSRALW